MATRSIVLIKEDFTKAIEYLQSKAHQMNEKVARKAITMFESLYQNDLRNNGSLHFMGTEALYAYRALGLDEEFHSEFNKYVEQRETNKEFDVSGQKERIKYCYYRTDRMTRGGKDKIHGSEGDEFKINGYGRYEWSEVRMGIKFVVCVYQMTLGDELVLRRQEIMQRPVRSKWEYNEVNYLAEVLHGIPTNMTSSHLTKDKKDVNPKLITPEGGGDNKMRETHNLDNCDCETRGLKKCQLPRKTKW